MTKEQRLSLEREEASFLRALRCSGSSAGGAKRLAFLRLQCVYNALGLEPPSREWLLAKHKGA